MFVDLIGCGGTGSYLAIPMAKLLKKYMNYIEVHLYDADKVEENNIERQGFFPSSISFNKVNPLQKEILDLDISCYSHITYVNKKVYSNILSNRDSGVLTLCIACVDNQASRKAVIEAISESNRDVIFITPGNELDYGQVITWAYINGKSIGTNPLELYPSLNKPTDRIPGDRGCSLQKETNTQIICANLMAASLTLNTLYNIINGYFYELMSFDINKGVVNSLDKVHLDIK
jgi:hypothetical protein